MPYLETRDRTRLFYKDWGTGAPVVFLHGWPLSADMWELQMPWLRARGHRCVAPDRRGFGRSDQPGGGYDFDTFADDLAALLAHLDLRGVTVVSYSMGGGEIARYLARHGSGRIARVAMIGTVTPFLPKADDNPLGLDPSLYDFMVAALETDRPRFLAEGVPTLFAAGEANRVSPAFMQWMVGLALQASPLATTACVRAFSETDFRPDLAAVDVPLLLLHGDADLSAPIDLTARATARAVPGSRLVEYPGAPHGLFATERDRLNADLLAFIARPPA